MSNEELKVNLQILEQKIQSYKPLVDVFFNTLEEATAYQKSHEAELKKYKELVKEKEAIEWELMTEKERLEKIKYLNALKQKYKED